MANKKQAGTERPYTWDEFFDIIRGIVREQVPYWNELDYLNVNHHWTDKPIDLGVWDWHIISETDFGGSEGVYSDFYVRMEGEPRRHIATAKTLREGDDAYIAMHEFAARVCLVVRDYVQEHEDEFNWTGFDVGYYKDGERVTYMLSHKRENAMKHALKLKQKGERAWIRDNAERKYEEV